MKKEYIAPDLEDLGSMTELTLGGSSGSRLDADFSAGTAYGDLTFS
jgi:hypothetical protein